MIQTVLLVLHVSVSIALIALILLQQGKGADAGAAFGSGASSTVFGARGSATFLSRLTGGLAAAFFGLSIGLAFLSTQRVGSESIVDQIIEEPADPAQTAPPVPSDPPVEDMGDVPKIPNVPAE